MRGRRRNAEMRRASVFVRFHSPLLAWGKFGLIHTCRVENMEGLQMQMAMTEPPEDTKSRMFLTPSQVIPVPVIFSNHR